MAIASYWNNKDTFINSASPDSNHGGDWGLYLDDTRSYLFGWDITSTIEVKYIERVDLLVWSMFPHAGCGCRASIIRRVISPWTEYGVTWNNKPTTTYTNQYHHTMLCDGYDWYDMTDLYCDAKSAGNDLSIEISVTGISPSHHICTSKETSERRPPKLYITWSPGNANRYVKTTGNDSLSGTSWGNAWKTLNKAATTLLDGQILHVEEGTYNAEPAGNKIPPQKMGTNGIKYQVHTSGGGTGTATVIVEKN